MKKYLKFLYLFAILLFFINTNVSADLEFNINWETKKINLDLNNILINSEDVTREEIFNYIWNFFDKEIPPTYKYINLNFKDIQEDSNLYKSLQKLVYLNIIENPPSYIKKDKKLSYYNFLKLLEKAFSIKLINKSYIEEFKNKNTNKKDLEKIKNLINKQLFDLEKNNNWIDLNQKKAIFDDVYNTILKNHFDKDELNEIKIIDSAIEWITKWTDDKHTVYFPAIESKNFYDTLNWEYEWIWAYVDMEKPWIVKIVSPINGTPSMKAWLKWWDIIIKVDQKEIKKENSLVEVISWIKWPAWTKVILTIKRWTLIINIEVIREKIIIKDVEFKLIDNNTFYIEIKSFWENVWNNFKLALEELKTKTNVNKVIIDLRNNGGGYLWEVTNMLSYFVKKWDPTTVVKYINYNNSFY